MSVLIGFLFGLAAVLCIELTYFLVTKASLVEITGHVIVNLVAYGGLAYCYFNFINLGETARRIRIVREIFESKNGLSLDELLGRYNASKMIDLRLQRMISKGQIIYREDRYYIGKPIMLWIAKVIIMMKLLFLKKRSESG